MIGQLITSFLLGKASPITTSTTFNHYADHAMEESKTGCCSVSPGATLGTTQAGRGGVGIGVGVLRVLNDLLPYSLRPIKAKRRGSRVRYPIGAEIYWARRLWHSHWKYIVREKINKFK